VTAQTRWSVDDLLGRLLDEEGDRWKLLSLPALAEANDPLGREINEPLWADDPKYNYPAFIAEQKRALPARMFVSLFQQAPVSPEGNMFKGEWLRVSRVPPDPDTSNYYVGLDLATSEARGADFSAIVTIACDMNGDYHVVDVFRKQTTIDKVIDELLDRCRDYRPQFIATEKGGLINASGPFLRSRQIERNIYTRIETVPSRHSKEIRAQSFIGRAAVKGLYLPQQADWLSDFVGELIAFPSGRTDDCVDAIAVIFQVLQNITPGPAPKPKEEPKRLVIGDPQATTLTLTDLFESREKGKGRYRRGTYERI
jgi:predicted phage terminase large subunit-like protein